MSDLPSGWTQASIADVAELNPKQILDAETLAGFVPMSHAPTNFVGKLRFDECYWHEINKGYTHFKDGDLIFAKVTPCFENGKAALVEGLPNGVGAGSTEFYVLRPLAREISTKYLLAVVKSHDFMREGTKNMTGAVGLRRVPKKYVENYHISLPPAAEQSRIAQKLHELLAQVDTLRTRIDAIPTLLNHFRKSVLAAAVSGRLTEQWRAANAGLVDDGSSVAMSGQSGECPDGLRTEAALKEVVSSCGWGMSPINKLVTELEQGWSPKCESESVDEMDDSWAVIKTTAIQAIDFHPLENKKLPSTLAPRPGLTIKPGDVLITRAGPRARAAVCCFVKKTKSNLMLCDKAYRFRSIDQKISGLLLCYFLNSPQYLHILDGLKTGISDSGVNLTMKKFLAVELPTPPRKEQTEIVHRVEELFAFAEQLESKVQAAKARIDLLSQSILAKALRGELVQQDPNDEPARVLLERIRAQRAAQPKVRRGRKAGATN